MIDLLIIGYTLNLAALVGYWVFLSNKTGQLTYTQLRSYAATVPGNGSPIHIWMVVPFLYPILMARYIDKYLRIERRNRKKQPPHTLICDSLIEWEQTK